VAPSKSPNALVESVSFCEPRPLPSSAHHHDDYTTLQSLVSIQPCHLPLPFAMTTTHFFP
jgi:hypothetical protein